MGPDVIKPDFVACKQQRRRSDCAFAQSDQHLCYSLSRKYYSLACYPQSFKIPATSSLYTWADWFESYFVGNSDTDFLAMEPI